MMSYTLCKSPRSWSLSARQLHSKISFILRSVDFLLRVFFPCTHHSPVFYLKSTNSSISCKVLVPHSTRSSRTKPLPVLFHRLRFVLSTIYMFCLCSMKRFLLLPKVTCPSHVDNTCCSSALRKLDFLFAPS